MGETLDEAASDAELLRFLGELERFLKQGGLGDFLKREHESG